MHKNVLKTLSVTTCKPPHKAAKIPNVNIDICKPYSAPFPKVLANLCLNNYRHLSLTKICKYFRNVAKFSDLVASKTAH